MIDFMGAAFRSEGGFPLWFGILSNVIPIVAFLICYLAIVHICYKMFQNYMLVIENEERRNKAREEISNNHVNEIIEKIAKGESDKY